MLYCFFDDLTISSSAQFSNLAKVHAVANNLYFVFISRLEDDGLDFGGGLSYSINCVYDLKFDGKMYFLTPYYVFPSWPSMHYDVAVTEDTGGNYEYLKRILTIPVEHVSVNKSTMVADIRRLIERGNRSILVFVDTAAYGCHMEDFCYAFEDLDCNITILSLYECFEELLCQSNMVSRLTTELSDLDFYANQFLSWETYFEMLLEKVTSGTHYMHKHKRIV